MNTTTVIVHYGYVSDLYREDLQSLLDESEQRRAGKFIRAEDRMRYITCRSILKRLLSKYTRTEINKILIQYSPGGKPLLPGLDAIQFNVSHCRDMVIWGFANKSIGVDVEHIDSEISIDALSLVCTEEELGQLKNVPLNERQEVYINCWTSKEAKVKAFGSRAEVLASAHNEPWHIHNLELPGSYKGAVAINGTISHLDISPLNGTWHR